MAQDAEGGQKKRRDRLSAKGVEVRVRRFYFLVCLLELSYRRLFVAGYLLSAARFRFG